jgi:hypothetical protein
MDAHRGHDTAGESLGQDLDPGLNLKGDRYRLRETHSRAGERPRQDDANKMMNLARAETITHTAGTICGLEERGPAVRDMAGDTLVDDQAPSDYWRSARAHKGAPAPEAARVQAEYVSDLQPRQGAGQECA